MNEVAHIASLVAWGGFALAFVFGAVAVKTHFCTMGAVSDIVNMGDWTRMRMWVLAIAVAIIGATALELAGVFKLADSIYPTANFAWLAYAIGGALFGFGMVLGSGCGSKTLVRIGGGNLKSLVVALCLAIAAYMTLKGLFAPLRVALVEATAIQLAGTQDLPALAARAFGLDRPALLALFVALTAGGLFAFVFARREGRSFDVVLGGIVVGLVVVGGWLLTGHFGHLAEHPETLEEAWIATNTGRMESLTFVAPQAYTLELGMLWTDKSKLVTFGVASALGVIAGSFAYSIATGRFRLEGFRDSEDLANHMVGGVLMGIGGVTAMGCTIGQGITGLSTLAAGSFIAFAGIIGGAIASLKYQSWRIERLETELDRRTSSSLAHG